MKNKILVVDDERLNIDILTGILEDAYDVMTAQNGQEAMDIMREYGEDITLILLDLVMPKGNGFEVLKSMREYGLIEMVPVLVITSEKSLRIEKKCFEYGVSDFIHKPFDNTIVLQRVNNIAELYTYRRNLENNLKRQREKLNSQFKIMNEQAEKIHQTNVNIIDILGTVVEFRNLESGEHVKRIKGYTEILANEAMKLFPEYELTPEKIALITEASALHDIGKIVIPDNILLKEGKLTNEEYECMKTHTTRGSEILENIEGSWDEEYGRISIEICRHHHERYDGKGYPDNLVGEEIPISAQLVSIADVYDALVNKRCYKEEYSYDEAFRMIMEGECGVFSPKLLECFKNTRLEFEAMAKMMKAS